MKSQKFKLGRQQEARAMELYHKFYHNPSYALAVKGKTNTYANQLINESLALCGHPHYRLSNRNWSQEALEFLSKFQDKQ